MTTLFLILAINAIYLLLHWVVTAPMGHEDETGFHQDEGQDQ